MTPEEAKQYADVSAYRNTLTILKNLGGTLNETIRQAKKALANDAVSTPTRSGWAMERYGGKSHVRWSEIVAKKTGFSGVTGNMHESDQVFGNCSVNRFKGGRAGIDFAQSQARKCQAKLDERRRQRDQVSRLVFDLVTQIRRLETEMNRLRIPLPFDLRQLMNQLRDRADEARMSNDPNRAPIAVMVILDELLQFKNHWRPTMVARIKQMIRKANLAKKVEAESIRAENEKTIEREEKREKDKERAKKEQEKKRDKEQVQDKPDPTGVDKDAKAPSDPERAPRTSATSSQPSPGGPAFVPATQAGRAYLQKNNEQQMRTMAKKSGDDGDNRGIALGAGALAVLALLGQG
jgi:hypothetical protein